jgi:actin-like ATPase involved in cell morphogenesis
VTWSLGVDFGTSYTVAAVATGSVVNAIDVESNGRDRIPSAVYLTPDAEILVGTAAQHQAPFGPERYEPTPKRLLGEGSVFLGDGLVPVVDLAAAVLRRVYAEACRQQGERAPSQVRVTHPAEWAETRLNVLREAIQRAGLPEVTLVPEPVAAAVRIAFLTTQPGEKIAVYDFGGGTFDAAVLSRTADGFEVAGPPAGRDPLGGEDIDRRIVDHLGELLSPQHPEQWQSLLNPPDVAWRRDAADFRREVQQAKETLSEVTACQLWVPGIERDVQLTRAELDDLIAPDVDLTVDTLEAALAQADVKVEQLAGLYLVGGSSRIPLVAQTLWRRLGVRPAVQDNPKSVVAMGAAAWTEGALPRSATAPPVALPDGIERVEAPPASRPGRFRSQVAMALDHQTWPQGYACTAQLVADHAADPPLTVRARDEPARGLDAGGLAERSRAVRASRTPGFWEESLASAAVLGLGQGLERRFTMRVGDAPLTMLEQYLVVDGRAYTVAFPESVSPFMSSFRVEPASHDGTTWYQAGFAVEFPEDWSVTEAVTLQRNGTGHTVTAERAVLPAALPAEDWLGQQIDVWKRRPGSRKVGQVQGAVLNQPGEILTVLWDREGSPVITKLGLATAQGLGYAMTITLQPAEQALFAPLARHARLGA